MPGGISFSSETIVINRAVSGAVDFSMIQFDPGAVGGGAFSVTYAKAGGEFSRDVALNGTVSGEVAETGPLASEVRAEVLDWVQTVNDLRQVDLDATRLFELDDGAHIAVSEWSFIRTNAQGDNEFVSRAYVHRLDATGEITASNVVARGIDTKVENLTLGEQTAGAFRLFWQDVEMDPDRGDGTLWSAMFDRATIADIGVSSAFDPFDTFPTIDEGSRWDLGEFIALSDGRVVGTSAEFERFETIAGEIGQASTLLDTFELHDIFAAPLSEVALVATADGGFLAAWAEQQSSGQDAVVVRRFDVDLDPVGESQAVKEVDVDILAIDIEVDGAGAALVSWVLAEGPGLHDVEARLITLDDLTTTGMLIEGTAGADQLTGTANDDTLRGGDGADRLDGLGGADIMEGGRGNDFYLVDTRADQVLGELAFSAGGGIDTVRSFVSYTQPENIELLRLGFLTGTNDLNGTGNDAPGTIVGNAGNNILTGRGGNDQINGNGGDDTLIGNTGVDTLVGGGGADLFVYNSISESRAGVANRDLINGFDRGSDQIDLSILDANLGGAGDAAFDFIGTARFSGTAGELRLQGLGGANAVLVEADLRGDGVADFQIFVNLRRALDEDDFIL